MIERGLLQADASCRPSRNIRGEGVVWGVECARRRRHCRPTRSPSACVEACYLGDEQGRAIHLLGPLAGKVIRVSPPLVMPAAEAEEYLGVMYDICSRIQ